jgi:hypothetical protein
MNVSGKKDLLFLSYYLIIIFLLTFPGPFDWSNRIQPLVLGIPFSVFYLHLGVALMCGGLIVQYLIEDKMGELDIDMDQLTSSTNQENDKINH